jgi:hypothetical protein
MNPSQFDLSPQPFFILCLNINVATFDKLAVGLDKLLAAFSMAFRLKYLQLISACLFLGLDLNSNGLFGWQSIVVFNLRGGINLTLLF